LLAALKKLRGTAFDIFGYAKVRRVERELIGEYRTLIKGILAGLSQDTVAQAVQLAELPDMIRGYEDVKLANVARFRQKVQEIQDVTLLRR
jgi:indolepyruvate ferredoxin oxidoreductase